MFNIWCLIFGMLMFSSLTSLLSSKLTEDNRNKRSFSNKASILRWFSYQVGISKELRVRVEENASEQKAREKLLVLGDVTLLSMFPSNLRVEVKLELELHGAICLELARARKAVISCRRRST